MYVYLGGTKKRSWHGIFGWFMLYGGLAAVALVARSFWHLAQSPSGSDALGLALGLAAAAWAIPFAVVYLGRREIYWVKLLSLGWFLVGLAFGTSAVLMLGSSSFARMTGALMEIRLEEGPHSTSVLVAAASFFVWALLSAVALIEAVLFRRVRRSIWRLLIGVYFLAWAARVLYDSSPLLSAALLVVCLAWGLNEGTGWFRKFVDLLRSFSY